MSGQQQHNEGAHLQHRTNGQATTVSERSVRWTAGEDMLHQQPHTSCSFVKDYRPTFSIRPTVLKSSLLCFYLLIDLLTTRQDKTRIDSMLPYSTCLTSEFLYCNAKHSISLEHLPSYSNTPNLSTTHTQYNLHSHTLAPPPL